MNIRPAKKTDFDFILEANRDINAHSHISEMEPQRQNRLKEDLFGKNPKCWVIIAEIDNKSVGMILYTTAYWTNDGPIMWLSQIYVVPEYRQKNIATALVERLQEIAVQNNYPRICGTVEQENVSMQRTLLKSDGEIIEHHRIFSFKTNKYPSLSL